MSNELLASKIIIQEEEPEVRVISGVATAVYGVVGVTERGPFTPQYIDGPEAYRKLYGGYTTNGYVAQAVATYFAEGGSGMWVQRVCHFTDPADPASKTSDAGTLTLTTSALAASKGFVLGTAAEPFDLVPDDTLEIAVDGGAPTTVTFTATQAARESTASETYVLVNGMTLTVKIDRGPVQTIEFLTAEFSNIAAATAEEVAAVINAKVTGAQAEATSAGTKVSIISDTYGTGSHVEVTGGTANAVLTFNTAEANGTGNVATINAVSVAEVKAAVEGSVAGVTVTSSSGHVRIERNVTGPAVSVLVAAASTADDDLGLDNATHAGTNPATLDCLKVDGKTDGTYANGLTIRITAATSGEATRFNLYVMKGTVIQESWPNLSMLDTDTFYVEKVINDANNGSSLITVTDLDAATDAASDRPASGTFGPLTGGNDGLAGLVDADFIGASSDSGRTGLRGFDTIEDLPQLAVPGRVTAAVHTAVVAYCAVTRGGSTFPILACPQGANATSAVTYTETTAGLLELSEFGAIYWGWVKIANPNRTVFGDAETITVPPESHIAGRNARRDASSEGGVFNAAAGTEDGVLLTALGVDTVETADERKRDLVYPKRINPITVSGGKVFIDGCRTLKSNGNFPSVPERRGVIFIEQSIKRGLQWARHKNNDATLRARVERTINGFLGLQCKVGAFRSKDPSKAYFVDVSDAINPLALTFAGKLKARIGLATQKPAEYIILSFAQDTRAFTPAA